MRNWVLPEYIEDVLPPEAAQIERLRGILLGLFRVHGYELVVPPMLEYVDSLLTGTGHDLDLRTFKLVDQLSGRMMGVRADITPQVARIDSHLLNRESVTRLCYCGSVLHTRPRGLDSTREPIQIGAEIYGHSGIESDLEIQRLLSESLDACGLRGVRLDIGHVGIFRSICAHGNVGADLEIELHEALEAKDHARIETLAGVLGRETRDALLQLPRLYGGAQLIDAARSLLPRYPELLRSLDDLERLARDNRFDVSVDLADLRGYKYHSGVVFSVYAGRAQNRPDGVNSPQCRNALALGGRYDEVGKAFGRARPATGFSLDLRDLARVLPMEVCSGPIRAPYGDDETLAAELARLRGSGQVVVQALPGVSDGLDCERELVRLDGRWIVRAR
ncbi:MAG: ATP phosphoribosyltransferase regulatory subunit [Betaproteobacteria bacterium RIFCSPLOWO2_02_FULL_62_17]|nr:MAG: ATP phosphoribosyltransferase regulatory subunit [Betaproteobacteria bacterium RIFCSPLOWO2_02_FULL_62_17]